MTVADTIVHVYVPLLTQETAVMISTFTYALKAGMPPVGLILLNSLAIFTDLLLFFLPAHILADRLHNYFQRRFQQYYDRAASMTRRIGVFRTSFALAFVLPSVAAMLVVGLLRLTFWRAMAGLFIGSAIYVVIPLLLAVPLADTLPAYVVPGLRWVAPALAVVVVVLSVARAQFGRQAES